MVKTPEGIGIEWGNDSYQGNNPENQEAKDKRKRFKKKFKSGIEIARKEIKENFDKLVDAYVDIQCGMVFRQKFSLKQWTKQWYSYIKNWKVWISWILEPKYENVAPCLDEYIWVRDWGKRWLLDADGNVLIDPEFDEVDGNTYKMDGKRWFINPNGEALEPKYDKIYEDWLVSIYDEYGNEKYGLVNRETGEEIVEPKYDKIYEDWRVMVKDVYIFTDSKYAICKMWLIDRKTGREIIDPNKNEYSFVEYPFKWYSVVVAKYLGKYGLISTIDWSIIKAFEYKSYSKDRKNKKLSLHKSRNDVEVFDCSPYEEAA